MLRSLTSRAVTVTFRAAAISHLRPCVLASTSLAPVPNPSASHQIRHYSAKPPLTFRTVEDRIMLVLGCYDKVDRAKLSMDADFVKDLGLDSLDHVELIMAMEDEFGFEIPDGDADEMKTPRHIFKYVCDREDVFA
ncbi:hypothetical protein WR25_24024 [Diploscapter pachys]|uniref:Acyl carrier protein n=1 Tax=Diploscapter pachys TaxID=2018661 RepID=A0A2A2JXU7_9BILA|nr:hypothetical protein WR25_24024 [Diploscapter pachys]